MSTIEIAVGAAGSATGLSALRSLTRWGKAVRCLACDTNPAHLVAAATEFEFLQVSSAMSDDYAGTLANQLDQLGITAYYPIHDDEISAASAGRKAFDARNITLLAPPDEAICIVRDKLRMAGLLMSAGVPSPPTIRLDHVTWEDTPLHVKPRTGLGIHGATAVCDVADFAKLQRRDNADKMIAQPLVKGDEITIDAFCPTPGTVQAIACRQRIEVKAGVSTKARIFSDSAFFDLTAQVSAAIGLTGSFCYQVRGTAREGWQVIDVNPRIGGGTAMSVAVGLDFPVAHAAYFLGYDTSECFETLLKEDVFVTRSYREHVAWLANR